MHSAPDLITRWPALEVAAKRARLQNSMHVSPGPLLDTVNAAKATATTSVPVVEINLPEPAALGAEFVRWEIATAVAGALLQIDPIDQPNVQQANDATRKLLDEYKTTKQLAIPTPDRTTDGNIALTLTSLARTAPQPFSFGTLEHAQVVGDVAALDAAGRRGLHTRLPAPEPALLREVGAMLMARLPRSS
jgi:hypothetical protein